MVSTGDERHIKSHSYLGRLTELQPGLAYDTVFGIPYQWGCIEDEKWYDSRMQPWDRIYAGTPWNHSRKCFVQISLSLPGLLCAAQILASGLWICCRVSAWLTAYGFTKILSCHCITESDIPSVDRQIIVELLAIGLAQSTFLGRAIQNDSRVAVIGVKIPLKNALSPKYT